jgi:transposase
LLENSLKAQKTQRLVDKSKKDIDEIDPLTEVFMHIISKKYKVMMHIHREDDAVLLVHLARGFGLGAITNHC